MFIGSNDVFERNYTQKFRALASPYGEFVGYERDRAGRDIGLHPTRPHSSGKELVCPSVVWFQLKGIQQSTLSKDDFDANDNVSLPLDVKHLKFWYMLPDPPYLVVYVESADVFLVCNIQKYIAAKWGDAVLSLTQQTVTVHIPKKHLLDDTAFYQIRLENETNAWADRFQVKRQDWQLVLVHYHLIYRLMTRKERSVRCRLNIRDWLSKTRLETDLLERPEDGSEPWTTVWSQWIQMGMAEDWRQQFPYISLAPTAKSGEEPYDMDDDFLNMFAGEVHTLRVSGGKLVYARDEVGECVDFECRVKLNALGERLAECLKNLIDAGFYDVNLEESHWISVAGFNDRGV